MITECAALIKTHDYRPQRTLEYPVTAVVPSQGGNPRCVSRALIVVVPESQITSRRFLAAVPQHCALTFWPFFERCDILNRENTSVSEIDR